MLGHVEGMETELHAFLPVAEILEPESVAAPEIG